MLEQYINWLVADHYISAASALLEEGLDLLPSLEVNRSLSEPREEMLLTYALGQVESLGKLEDVDSVYAAYWFWVKTLTAGDLALNTNRYAVQHEQRIDRAFDKLLEWAQESDTKAVLKAARKFHDGRREYYGRTG